MPHAFSLRSCRSSPAIFLNIFRREIWRGIGGTFSDPQKFKIKAQFMLGFRDCVRAVFRKQFPPRKSLKLGQKWGFVNIPNPEGPAIEKIQSRLIAWNFQSIRLKVSIQDWKFQSRLKVSISLENFNPDLDNSPQQEPYFQSRLKISISIENFNLRLVAWKFQSRSEILKKPVLNPL